MSDKGQHWSEVRARLRRFHARSNWTAAEIGRALREAYGAVGNDLVERLLCVDAPNPRNRLGLSCIVVLLDDHAGKVPTFNGWQRQFRAARDGESYWVKQEAVTVQAVALEEARAKRVADILAQEVRHGGRLVIPSTDPLAGFDAATIAALSGGTIVARGVRL